MHRLMKSLLGSCGNWNTITSPRRGPRSPGSRMCVNGILGPYSNLFTNRKSPIRSVSSIEAEGMRNAWITKARKNKVRTSAHSAASTYSLTIERADDDDMDLLDECLASMIGLAFHLEHRQERFLRHLDGSDLLHTTLAFLLFLEQLALASNVAA